jgi:[ribosomal protein S18]-alanine N-acetyltransferase
MPDRLVVRTLTDAHSRDIAGWRHSGPWHCYDLRPEDGPPEADDGYHALVGDPGGELVGFLCTGEEARVPGIGEEPDVVDVGVGMRPELVGQGYGARFGEAVLDHLRAIGASTARAGVTPGQRRAERGVGSSSSSWTAAAPVRQPGSASRRSRARRAASLSG